MDAQAEISSKAPESDKPLPTVSFLGPISSYTHQVCTLPRHRPLAGSTKLTDCDSQRPRFNASDPIYTLSNPRQQSQVRNQATFIVSLLLMLFVGVFEAVQSGTADLGIVPFENSSNGAVIFTLDLLADRDSRYGDITVSGDSYLDVSHYLLGRTAPSTDSPVLSRASTPTQTLDTQRPRSEPLTSIKHIQRIYTHPQAFGQCEIFLGKYLKGIERIDVSSTSRAAEMVREDATGTSAAIASSLAAEIYSLDILAKSIQDREDNRTRFFTLRNGTDEKAKCSKGPAKSLISFTVDHHSPGALADVLDCFRRHHLNLTSINSRPTKVIPFQYVFIVEFQGSLLQDPEGAVQAALDEVKKHAQSCRWLGSWIYQLSQKDS
jgi:prephenate dehydratase